MPMKPLKPCRRIGCNALTREGLCEEHRLQEVRAYSKNRPHYHKWYSLARWRNARLIYLTNNPLCIRCEQDGRLTPATVVDHVKPHKGNKELLWNSNNWQGLCKRCHDKKTASEDGAFGNERGRGD